MRKWRRTACRTRSLRPRSICGRATATHTAEGATAAATIAPAASAKYGRSASVTADRWRSESGHVVAEQVPERRVEGRPASVVEQRCQIGEGVARDDELGAVDMRLVVHEFLPQRPEEGYARRHLQRNSRRDRRMCAAGAITDDPVIDRITFQMRLGSRDIDGRCGASGHRNPAEPPETNFGRKSAIVWVFGDEVEHRPKPFDPRFELVPRVKRTRRETVRSHARLCGQLAGDNLQDGIDTAGPQAEKSRGKSARCRSNCRCRLPRRRSCGRPTTSLSARI